MYKVIMGNDEFIKEGTHLIEKGYRLIMTDKNNRWYFVKKSRIGKHK